MTPVRVAPLAIISPVRDEARLVRFTLNAMVAQTVRPQEWLFVDDGSRDDTLAIPYCSAGIRSAVTYVALRLIGHDHTRLFSGSFDEWSRHPELPVTKGSKP